MNKNTFLKERAVKYCRSTLFIIIIDILWLFTVSNLRLDLTSHDHDTLLQWKVYIFLHNPGYELWQTPIKSIHMDRALFWPHCLVPSFGIVGSHYFSNDKSFPVCISCSLALLRVNIRIKSFTLRIIFRTMQTQKKQTKIWIEANLEEQRQCSIIDMTSVLGL